MVIFFRAAKLFVYLVMATDNMCSAVSNSFATPWTVTHQVPLSMGIPRQEYWSGLPFPSAGDLSDPGIEPQSPALAGRFFTIESPGKPTFYYSVTKSSLTLCSPMDCSVTVSSVFHSLSEFAQIHVHCVKSESERLSVASDSL